MRKTGSLWSVPVAVEDIPDTGLHIEIEAPAALLLFIKQDKDRMVGGRFEFRRMGFGQLDDIAGEFD